MDSSTRSSWSKVCLCKWQAPATAQINQWTSPWKSREPQFTTENTDLLQTFIPAFRIRISLNFKHLKVSGQCTISSSISKEPRNTQLLIWTYTFLSFKSLRWHLRMSDWRKSVRCSLKRVKWSLVHNFWLFCRVWRSKWNKFSSTGRPNFVFCLI